MSECQAHGSSYSLALLDKNFINDNWFDFRYYFNKYLAYDKETTMKELLELINDNKYHVWMCIKNHKLELVGITKFTKNSLFIQGLAGDISDRINFKPYFDLLLSFAKKYNIHKIKFSGRKAWYKIVKSSKIEGYNYSYEV